ncbi:cyclic GMP-AMP synthase [Melanotaenia boesemani]|uniref:cyclic GMP-AMP synthase n=1 Tax=Melanotaenia boesemani TaxID=1250792 RepID=UPI001C05CC96|nr:cyclic GMP-AMP synthase [Melanotaenia boesemani]
MSGRGRSRKAKSPDSNNVTRYKEEKQEPPTRCPPFTEKKQKETTETKNAQDEKKTNSTDEKPSARNTSKKKTTNHDKVETNKQKGVPKDTTKAKASSTRTKPKEKSAGETENILPDMPKEQAKNAKTRHASRAKSAEKAESPNSMPAKNATRHKEIKQEPPVSYPAFTEEKQDETMKNQKVKDKKKLKDTDEKPSAQKTRKTKTVNHDTEEDNEQHGLSTGTKAKICSTKSKTRDKSTGEAKNTSPNMPGNAEFPEESAEKRKVQLERLEETQTPREEKGNSLLNNTLRSLRIRKMARSNTSEVVNVITAYIIKHLRKTKSFQDVDVLRTGSYYENVKISDPDEFDVMLCIPIDRVQIEAFGEDGAFYSVALKRGNNPLEKFQKGDVLSASEMLKEFREEVKKCLKEFTDWSMERKKKGCPAVTITTTVESIPISLDVVLCLEVKSSWPNFTNDGLKIEKWLGTKVKRDYKLMPYYLVPKYEGTGTKEKDGVRAKDVWRVSFSHIEKAILKNHGSEKTCCEREGQGCCRKDCLKLLKHLLHLLKKKNGIKFDKFCSYHVKTTLLHACCSRPKDSDWKASELNPCFQLLLQDFEESLKKGELYNFFIPSQNLLSGPSTKMCKELADYINKQCEEGFPIFEEELRK